MDVHALEPDRNESAAGSRLLGQAALVTGGARGLGEAYVRALVEEGAFVVIADVLEDAGARLAGKLAGNAAFHPLDVTAVDSWTRLAAYLHAEVPPVKVLINNAGVHSFGGVLNTPVDEWRRVMAINVDGPMIGIRIVAPLIRANGGGTIINVSSTCGITGYGDQAAYVASKWAVRGLTRAAAMDLAPSGIRVHCLVPGPFATPMTQGFEDDLVQLAATQPIGRVGMPYEAGRLVRYLCVDATYSTGSEFYIDGGAMAGVPNIRHD